MQRFDKTIIRQLSHKLIGNDSATNQVLTEQLDENNDGEISEAELNRYLAHHLDLTEELDENNDGEITEVELTKYLGSLSDDAAEEDVEVR